MSGPGEWGIVGRDELAAGDGGGEELRRIEPVESLHVQQLRVRGGKGVEGGG